MTVFVACVGVARMVLEMSDVYKQKGRHFDAIETAQTIHVAVRDDITRISLNDGTTRIATKNNAEFYIAWWHITHPATEFINKTIDALNECMGSAEETHTVVSTVLSEAALKQAAIILKQSFDSILKLIE